LSLGKGGESELELCFRAAEYHVRARDSDSRLVSVHINTRLLVECGQFHARVGGAGMHAEDCACIEVCVLCVTHACHYRTGFKIQPAVSFSSGLAL